MKKFQKLALGLMVGAMAIGFSAFTNAHTYTHTIKVRKPGMALDAYIVQGSTNFTQSSSFDADNCESTSTRYCGYDVTASGQTHITSQGPYTSSQIDTYVSNGWLDPDASATKAIYNP